MSRHHNLYGDCSLYIKRQGLQVKKDEILSNLLFMSVQPILTLYNQSVKDSTAVEAS